jgi:hypothetical protein
MRPMIPIPLVAALGAALLLATPCFAAELPSGKKAKATAPTQSLRHCDLGGVSGVLAANGVCVHLGGYVSAGVGAQNVK